MISGPGSCTGSGATIDCGAEGIGSGVWVDNDAQGVTIRKWGDQQYAPDWYPGRRGNGHLFEDLKIRHNHSFGLVADERMIVRNCTVTQNGGEGIKLNDGSIVEGSVTMGNGSHGIHLVNEGGSVLWQYEPGKW